jgi:predicted fused transcriptional regulator/phosphomethylpyrimidine kinase/predicted transcriptional regulator
MTLQLPSEIVVERFLPAARERLAAELDERGLSQREIADRLGVSQAAVSGYLAAADPNDGRFHGHPRMVATMERIADGFATGTMDEYEALAELLELVRTFEDRGPICAVHEEEMPALEGTGCDLCVRGRDPTIQAEREVLSNVRRAVRRLTTVAGIAGFIPNVGTNVGMALPDPADVTDVAAVPGRIHAMREGVNVPANPEFGASEHVATVVLAAAGADRTVRGAVNLVTDESLLASARDAGLTTVGFDADYEHRRERLDDLFADAAPTVVYHEGAFGVEPITYVLGTSALEAVETAAALIRETG